MKNQYFNLNYPIISKFEIESSPGNNHEISQDIADNLFMKSLRRVCMDSHGSKAEIEGFLNHQLQATKLPKHAFIEHLEMIFTNYSYTLKPYNFAVGYFADWIKKHKQVDHTPKEPKAVPVRKDPAFEDIVYRKKTMEDILQNFRIKGIIDSEGRWTAEKNRLVAFIHFLLDNNLIKKLKDAQLGRIFCAEFKVKMQPRAFSQIPKDANMAWVKAEAGVLKFY